MAPTRSRFTFDGSPSNFAGTALLGFFTTVLTLGVCYPFAFVRLQRWRCEHSYVDGQQLIFNGQATELFRRWILWLPLSILSFGVFLFWVGPRLEAWKIENTGFAVPIAPISSWAPNVLHAN